MLLIIGKSKLFWKEVSKVGNKREEVITWVKTVNVWESCKCKCNHGNVIQDETEVKIDEGNILGN